MTDSFTTSRGRKIRFLPGYIEHVNRVIGIPDKVSPDYELASFNVARGSGNVDLEKAAALNETHAKPVSVMGYAGRALSVYRMLKMLQTTNLTFPVGKLLDIGTGYGFQPRIIKGIGLAKEVTGIELWDRASSVDEKNLARQHKRLMRYWWIIDKIQARIDAKPSSQWGDHERAFMLRFQGPRIFAKYRQCFALGPDFYDMKFVQEPHLDRLLIKNLFELDEKFDFITAFSSMEWFETDSTFEKISSMLNPGGIFYMYVGNWWHSVAGGLAVGHFPFAAQRMEAQDYSRYVAENFPDKVEAMKASADFYDPKRPTLNDYIQTGWKHNMLALHYEQDVSFAPGHKKYGVSSRGWGELEPGVLNEVLDDIHAFRPDVTMADLLAMNNYVLFKKVDKDRKVTQQDYQALFDENRGFIYRPQNPLMKAAKYIGRKIMWSRPPSY